MVLSKCLSGLSSFVSLSLLDLFKSPSGIRNSIPTEPSTAFFETTYLAILHLVSPVLRRLPHQASESLVFLLWRSTPPLKLSILARQSCCLNVMLARTRIPESSFLVKSQQHTPSSFPATTTPNSNPNPAPPDFGGSATLRIRLWKGLRAAGRSSPRRDKSFGTYGGGNNERLANGVSDKVEWANFPSSVFVSLRFLTGDK